MNDVSLWATNNQMAWIMKIAKRLQVAPNFRRPVSRAPPLREQLLDEAQAVRDLASLLRGDGKKKIDLVASMHMLKLQ